MTSRSFAVAGDNLAKTESQLPQRQKDVAHANLARGSSPISGERVEPLPSFEGGADDRMIQNLIESYDDQFVVQRAFVINSLVNYSDRRSCRLGEVRFWGIFVNADPL